MSRRFIQPIVLVLLLTGCGGAPKSTPIEADAPAEPVASVPKGDLVGVWVGTEGQPSFRFAEDGRYCLSIIRDELDTLPGDCGTYEVSEMSLVLTSDKYTCKGDVGSYEFEVTELGQLHIKVFDDDCFERMTNIDNEIFEPES